jgi:sortase A
MSKRSRKDSDLRAKRRSKVGVLIGIPALLFIAGIVLITIAGYNYMKFAFYMSSLFIHDDFDRKAVVENEDRVYPKYGEEYAELRISSADIVAPVYCGDNDQILLKGIGQFYGSRFPGEDGNTVLSGHRNSVFQNLGKVKIGEEVILETAYGKFIYEVVDIDIKDGRDQSIVQPKDEAVLTMYTCYPFDYIGNAPDRYVVTAKEVAQSRVLEGDLTQ